MVMGLRPADNMASACEMPLGYVENADDCDDDVATINPDAAEVCDGIRQ